MKTSWFGVKTVFRSRALGSPAASDQAYDADVDLVEERVVLFRAMNVDDAIERAEVEAKQYAKGSHRNPYGQRVVTEYLGACDAFTLFDPPAAGVEVYSTTCLVPRTEARRAILDRGFGSVENVPDKRRCMFLNREYSGVVGAAPHKALQPTSRAQRKSGARRKARGSQLSAKSLGRHATRVAA